MNRFLLFKWHRRRIAERSCAGLLCAVVLLGVSAHRTLAQQFDSASDELSIGDSEYDTPTSVGDDLERDLSAGDNEYDTPEASESFLPRRARSAFAQGNMGSTGTSEAGFSQPSLFAIFDDPRYRTPLVLALIGAALLCFLNTFVVIEA